MSPEEAWSTLKKASDEKDLDDFRTVWKNLSKIAIQLYIGLADSLNRVSRSTPKQFPTRLLLTSKRNYVRTISSFIALPWRSQLTNAAASLISKGSWIASTLSASISALTLSERNFESSGPTHPKIILKNLRMLVFRTIARFQSVPTVVVSI